MRAEGGPVVGPGRSLGRRSALRHAVAQSQRTGTGEGDQAEGREQRSEAHTGAREVGAAGAVGRGVLGSAVVDGGDGGAVVLSGVIALVVAVARGRGGGVSPVVRGRGGGVVPVARGRGGGVVPVACGRGGGVVAVVAAVGRGRSGRVVVLVGPAHVLGRA